MIPKKKIHKPTKVANFLKYQVTYVNSVSSFNAKFSDEEQAKTFAQRKKEVGLDVKFYIIQADKSLKQVKLK